MSERVTQAQWDAKRAEAKAKAKKDMAAAEKKALADLKKNRGQAKVDELAGRKPQQEGLPEAPTAPAEPESKPEA